MSRPTTMITRRLASGLALAVALAAGAGCGVDATGVMDSGPVPVISARSALASVYLLRDGRLAPRQVVTASASVRDVIAALFEVGTVSPEGLESALKGFRLEQTTLSRYGRDGGMRDAPDNPVGLRLHVIVNGSSRLPRAALAQLTCTGRLREEIWSVKITQTTPKGPQGLGEHTCREYHDLAAPGVSLPP
ncbi:hypothetical protein [Sphaerisporangium fuscum]|uniref:hypothetical protein n=1 Tax=Sphaerisporangium fuscum TaxID=2835868 RepID=UPI001BDC9CC8|nr:hypothetical protein [Sphaerisporangium fuscum]